MLPSLIKRPKKGRLIWVLTDQLIGMLRLSPSESTTNAHVMRANAVFSHSNFSRSFFLNTIGSNEPTAKTTSRKMELREKASLVDVSLWSVVPAWIATNDGGATPVDGMRAKLSIQTVTCLKRMKQKIALINFISSFDLRR